MTQELLLHDAETLKHVNQQGLGYLPNFPRYSQTPSIDIFNMKKTSKFSRLFKFFWMRHEKPCPSWDKKLNELISKGIVTELDEYVITFENKYKVWIKNHTYFSGHLYDHQDLPELHCSKKTVIRLEDFVNVYLDSIKNKIFNSWTFR